MPRIDVKNATCGVLLALSPCVTVASMLDSRPVTSSSLYTGETGRASIQYTSLDDWLEYRRANGRVDDVTIAQRGFLIDTPQVTDELYDMANSLLAQWPGVAPRIAIFVKSGSSYAYGGEVTKVNEILIDLGTLSNARSYDEVVSLVAHELSHILLEHNARLNYIDLAESTLQNYRSVSTFMKSVEASEFVSDTNQFRLVADLNYERDMQRISAQQELASRFYRAAHLSLFNRSEEIEADQLAVDLMVAAGYAPMGLKEAFGGLSASYTFLESLSHTLMQRSDELLEQYSDEFEGLQDQGDEAVEDGLESVLGRFGNRLRDATEDAATSALIDRLEASHPVPRKREEDFIEYLYDNYSRRERGKRVDRQSLEDYVGSPAVSRAVASNRLAMDAFQRLASDDFENAARALGEARSVAPVTDPFVNYVVYRTESAQGNRVDAVAALRGIGAFAHVPSGNIVGAAEFLMRHGTEEALELASTMVDQKEAYLGIVPDFYPAKIQLAQRNEGNEQAQALARECVNDFSHMEALYEQCAPYAGLAQDEPRESRGALRVFDEIESTLDDVSDTLGLDD